jgi:pyruvoyl-dependent arginine decarboxylase (PvlArgDC)
MAEDAENGYISQYNTYVKSDSKTRKHAAKMLMETGDKKIKRFRILM